MLVVVCRRRSPSEGPERARGGVPPGPQLAKRSSRSQSRSGVAVQRRPCRGQRDHHGDCFPGVVGSRRPSRDRRRRAPRFPARSGTRGARFPSAVGRRVSDASAPCGLSPPCERRLVPSNVTLVARPAQGSLRTALPLPRLTYAAIESCRGSTIVASEATSVAPLRLRRHFSRILFASVDDLTTCRLRSSEVTERHTRRP